MKRLFMLAAIAALLMVSCDLGPSGGGVPDDQTSIVVRVSGPGSASRAVSAPAEAGKITITGGTNWVYVVEGEAITWKEPLTATPGGAGQVLASTAGENGGQRYFPKTAQIYILANIPASILAPESFTTMDDIEAAVVAISTSALSDYTKPAMGNVGGTPKALDSVEGEGTADPRATVDVSIAPLFTRVELKGINGGVHMASFTVAGIYLNNYYSSYSLTGAGSVINKKDKETVYDLSTWMGDAPGIEWTSAVATDDQDAIAPTEGVWAYHVGAGTLVNIVLKLANPMVYEVTSGEGESEELSTTATKLKIDEVEVDEAFITISSYTNGIETFERGKIYQIGVIDFDASQLATTPNPDGVKITASVTVKDWEFVPLTPNI